MTELSNRSKRYLAAWSGHVLAPGDYEDERKSSKALRNGIIAGVIGGLLIFGIAYAILVLA